MNDLNVSATPNPKNPNDISFGRRQLDLNAQKEQEIEQRKREEKVFSSYFQLNKKALPLLDLCLAEKPKAFRLLMFIINHMNKRNYVECSRSVFEKALGLSRSTTYEQLKYLQDLNCIHTERAGKNTRYIVNPNIIWRSKKQYLKYCPFPEEKLLLRFPETKKTLIAKVVYYM